MSDKPKHEHSDKAASKAHEHKPQPAPMNNVVAFPNRCAVKDCKKSPTLVNFCNEHYEWFKFGMITKNGDKPVDFDKKQQAFMKHKKAA